MVGTSKATTTSSSKKSVEQRYSRLKDGHEHILKRPNVNLGSVIECDEKMWVYNNSLEDSGSELVFKNIKYVPGMYKIFDEILVNARDHKVRCDEEKLAERCTMIKVSIDAETGRITVWNNGAPIPVVIHKTFEVYVPSLIFGELYSSENYDDTEKKKVGGQNGLGAKLTNIMSTEFEIEVVDIENKKKFYQKYSNKMH